MNDLTREVHQLMSEMVVEYTSSEPTPAFPEGYRVLVVYYGGKEVVRGEFINESRARWAAARILRK